VNDRPSVDAGFGTLLPLIGKTPVSSDASAAFLLLSTRACPCGTLFFRAPRAGCFRPWHPAAKVDQRLTDVLGR